MCNHFIYFLPLFNIFWELLSHACALFYALIYNNIIIIHDTVACELLEQWYYAEVALADTLE